MQEKIKNRYRYNYKIIEKIMEQIEENHDLRFNQILYALGIIKVNEDSFYIEPKDIYERIIENEIKR